MFAEQFLSYCRQVVERLDRDAIEAGALVLSGVRERQGRLFIIGSGGGAGHASHATCDFRKICNIEAYAPYDNISELTARINDEGWDGTIAGWLAVSKLSARDGLLVFSVGGGSVDKNISMNLVNAMKSAQEKGTAIVAIVGKDGGYAATAANVAIVIPDVNAGLVTPLTEGFQAVIWHLLVSHPALQVNTAKWESLSTGTPQL